MAKKKSPKKRNKKSFIEKFLPTKFFPVKSMLIFLLCAALLAGTFCVIRYFFLNSQFFVITEVVVNKDRVYSFREGEDELKQLYVGRNIFGINLAEVQLLIKRDFPQLKKVEVRRGLPDRIEVDIVSREPVAVINTGGGMIIDIEGTVLAIGEKDRGLMNIRGIRFFLNKPSKGEKINNRALNKALVLLKAINKKLHRDKRGIKYIDISDRNNILLNISSVAIKMGGSDFPGKIDKLKQILQDPNMDMKDIKSIDLRFEDAVISPR